VNWTLIEEPFTEPVYLTAWLELGGPNAKLTGRGKVVGKKGVCWAEVKFRDTHQNNERIVILHKHWISTRSAIRTAKKWCRLMLENPPLHVITYWNSHPRTDPSSQPCFTQGCPHEMIQ
jgi:hypothetical protein